MNKALSPGMQRWHRECRHVVHIAVRVPPGHTIEDLVAISTQYTDWLAERDVLAGDFVVDRAVPQKGYVSWVYRFRNPDVAMLFKLTWGGV